MQINENCERVGMQVLNIVNGIIDIKTYKKIAAAAVDIFVNIRKDKL